MVGDQTLQALDSWELEGFLGVGRLPGGWRLSMQLLVRLVLQRKRASNAFIPFPPPPAPGRGLHALSWEAKPSLLELSWGESSLGMVPKGQTGQLQPRLPCMFIGVQKNSSNSTLAPVWFLYHTLVTSLGRPIQKLSQRLKKKKRKILKPKKVL